MSYLSKAAKQLLFTEFGRKEIVSGLFMTQLVKPGIRPLRYLFMPRFVDF